MSAAWFKRLIRAVAVAVLLLFVAVAGRVVASATFDQVNGKVIPTTLQATYTFAGGTVPSYRAHTSGSTTLAATDDVILITAGTAATLVLPDPATIPTGKVWSVLHYNGTNATVLSADPFSVNGAVSNNALDASGNSALIVNTGTGYVAGMNN